VPKSYQDAHALHSHLHFMTALWAIAFQLYYRFAARTDADARLAKVYSRPWNGRVRPSRKVSIVTKVMAIASCKVRRGYRRCHGQGHGHGGPDCQERLSTRLGSKHEVEFAAIEDANK